jgi:proline iminopeptidase
MIPTFFRVCIVVTAVAFSSFSSIGDNSTAGTIEIGSTSLPYVREGAGDTAVIVGSSVYYPRAFSGDLRNRLDIVFPDSRHFASGYNPPSAELAQLSLDTWADDLEAVRKELGIDQWIVIGHSIHGRIALEYAIRKPDKISRLVLIAPLPCFGDEVTAAARELWDTQASDERKHQHEKNTDGIEDFIQNVAPNRRFVANYVANAALYWIDPTYDSTPLWEGVTTTLAFGRLVQSIPPCIETRRALEQLQVPTLLILGKEDYAVPFTFWEKLVEGLGELDYILLDKASHNPQTESPELFDPVVIDWLSGQ